MRPGWSASPSCASSHGRLLSRARRWANIVVKIGGMCCVEHWQGEVTWKTRYHRRERIGTARTRCEREHLRLEVTTRGLNAPSTLDSRGGRRCSRSCNRTNLCNHFGRRGLDAKNAAAAASRRLVHVVDRSKTERAHRHARALLRQRARNQHACTRISLHDERKRGETVHHGHLDVEQNDVYLLQTQGIERVASVHCGGRHAHVFLRIDHPAQHATRDR